MMKFLHLINLFNSAVLFMVFNNLPIPLYVFVSLSIPVISSNKFYSDSCNYLGAYIDCSNKQLTKVSNELPSWTETLKLNKNSLTEIPYFISAHNLTHLLLGHNHIISISRYALESMSNLVNLELNNNDLKEVGPNDFPYLQKLQTLNLNHNDIVKIENGSFNGLTNLLDLKISRNKLSFLNEDAFKQLTTLRSLEINKNQLTKIVGLTFRGLDSLQTLRLRQNNIEDLEDGAFYGLFKLRELHLDYNKLVTVSKGWLYGLELLSHLNVSYNKIHSLNNGWESCPHLRELDVSNNKLESIPRGTFEHLTNLVMLKLDNNRISFIEFGAFEYLSSLEILDLSNNFISWMVENTNGAFSPLKRLTKLSLAGNKIFHISKDAFSGLINVNELDLSNNAIASIEEKAFSYMSQLKELLLNTSSLICDCSMKWLPSWLNDTTIYVKSQNLTCIHPPKLKKKRVQYISPEEFICSRNDSPQPQITNHPEDAVTVVGNNMTLRCGAISSVDSDMNFTWKMNNHRLDNAVVKRYESAQNEGVVQFSDLFLNAVSMSNSGMYQCIVSNNFGVAYSKPSQLSVFVFPSFLKTPSNVVVKVGNTAKLECSATGFPLPKISWLKDGGTDFPAAQGKRMKIMNISPDEPFFIVNVRLEDAGVYTCTAKNTAGFVSSNASLSVLEAPSFSKPMKNKEVQYGEAAVLECLAVGSPKPKITWTKNNKSLVLTKRHFLTVEEQLLIIMDTVLEDTGSYECELSNALGTKRGKSDLKILPSTHFFTPCYNSDINYQDVVGIIIVTLVLSVVITSAVWVIFIHMTRRNRRSLRTPLSPIDIKSENSSHSSKDSGTGDSTKRSYQDLLMTTATANHTSVMGNHSESPSPVPESTLPLLTTFHPVPIDGTSYIKENTCPKTKRVTPMHCQNKQQLEHTPGIFCASPASSNSVQCACLTATFKKTTDVYDCLTNNSPVKHQCIMNHCDAMTTDHEISCYGDIGKRPCSIPVPFHGTHSVTNCCRHHPNSYLCLYVPPAQHNVSQ